MKEKAIKIISPRERMPVPGVYFFICTQVGYSGLRIPAILRCYTDPENFYDNCKIFTAEGDSFGLKGYNNIIGWSEMFEDTKSFNVHYL